MKKEQESKAKFESSTKSLLPLRPINRKYNISKFKDRVEISWKWRTRELLFIIPFALFWNGLMFSMVVGGGFHLLMSIHIGVGIYLILLAIVLSVNSTSIRASKQKLQIKHHPFPWGEDYCFSVNEIRQVLVSRGTRSSKNDTWEVPILELVTVTGSSYELLKGKSGAEFTDYEHIRLNILDATKPAPMKIYEGINW